MFDQADLFDTLHSMPWFMELPADQIEKLVSISRLHQLPAGENLFKEFDKSDCLYLLLEGEVELSILVPSCGQVAIYDAQPLDVIGWDQLTPVIRQRFGSARAKQPSLLLAMNAEALRKLCEEDHEIGMVVYRRLANVVASRMLNIRLVLSDALIKHTQLPMP